MNDEWTMAQSGPADELVRLHYFSVKKQSTGKDPVEFIITVRESVPSRDDQSMHFFAQADKQTNQRAAPYTPCGWGSTLIKALGECVRAIHRFPYEPDTGS